MNNQELQNKALSIIMRQREKTRREINKALTRTENLKVPDKFALDPFVEKYPRRLKA
ncbi:hypothetical protein MRD22_005329, partial [Escherichia coli]|nr:hypothetical protein [Escherichia coli]EIZ9828841.1 hypothetical protein [Escherichia coli]